jgi:hypothetical protein
MWRLLQSLMGMQQEVEEGERRELSICVRRVRPGCCPGAARSGAARYARGAIDLLYGGT